MFDDNNFTLNTKGLSRMIEVLERSPKVLGLLYFIVFVLLLFALPAIITAIKG